MVRAMLYCTLAVLATVTAGCAMCAHPFDYCDPPPGGCGPCLPTSARAGSILSPWPVAASDVGPEQVMSDQVMSEEMESEQVVSDQVAPASDDAAAAFTAPLPDEVPEEPPRPVTASGWISRPPPPMR